MKYYQESFDLRAWRQRLGWDLSRAAQELGYSYSAYTAMEYRNEDRGPDAAEPRHRAPIAHPLDKTVARLCRILEARAVVE